MDNISEDQDHMVIYEGSQDLSVANPPSTTPDAQKKLDPALVKALKLFAKNHQQLERANDPSKGQHRRVLSQGGRTFNNQTPASIYERSGVPLPKGPKFYNEAVENELNIYKKEVEEKSKNSYMNNTYQFPRKNQATVCRTGPERSIERDQLQSQQKSEMKTFQVNHDIGRQSRIQEPQGGKELNKTFDKPAAQFKQPISNGPSQLFKAYVRSPNNFNLNKTVIEEQPKSVNLKPQKKLIVFQKTLDNRVDTSKKANVQLDHLPQKRDVSKGYTDTTTSPPRILNQKIVINRPIVIQYKNKKITFVNKNEQSSPRKNQNTHFYKSAAQRSPRNSVSPHFGKYDQNDAQNNNPIYFQNDLVKKKRTSKQLQSSFVQKGQVNNILQSILNTDHTNHSQSEQDQSFTSGSYATNFQKKQHSLKNQNSNFGNAVISKTQDSRTFQNSQLNNSQKVKVSASPQLPIHQINNKQKLNQIYATAINQQKQDNNPNVLINQLLTQQHQRMRDSHSNKQTPVNSKIESIKDGISQLMNERHVRKGGKSYSKVGGKIKPQSNFSMFANSIRPSFAASRGGDDDIALYRSKKSEDSQFILDEIQSHRMSSRRAKNQKPYKTSMNSPATELASMLSTHDKQSNMLTHQQKALLNKFQRDQAQRYENSGRSKPAREGSYLQRY